MNFFYTILLLLRWLSGKESICSSGNMGSRIQSPGCEDPLDKEMAPHSSILAWEIPWTEEPGGLQWKWNKVKVLGRSVMSTHFATPWTICHQASLSTRFLRQEYWSGLPFPSPGDLPDSGIKYVLLHCKQILYHLSHHGSPWGHKRVVHDLATKQQHIASKVILRGNHDKPYNV